MIVREERLPGQIKHFAWDVNGTITKGDKPDQEILRMIVEAARKGAHHSFITGRDAEWLKNFLISPLEKIEGYEEVKEKLHFYPELSLIILDPVSGEEEMTDMVVGHPIANPEVRQKLANLFYQPENLNPYNGGEKPGFFAGKDANENAVWFPEKPEILFPSYCWSTSKKVLGTAEVIRKIDGTLNKKCAAEIQNDVARLENLFKDWGLHNHIKPSPVSTAINFVPIVSGIPLDKHMATGLAVRIVAEKIGVSIPEIIGQTIAIGDGTADLLFTTPIMGMIPLIFVGPKSQLRPSIDQERQLAILGQGAIEAGGLIGPVETIKAMKIIMPRIAAEPKVIFTPGKNGREEFEGEERLKRGIHWRIKHDTPPIQYHDACLDSQTQAGHSHQPDDYETIVLLEGSLDALAWDREKVQVFHLREQGDMIIFPKQTAHTLIVLEDDTRINVIKHSPNPFRRADKWTAENLPLGLQEIREQMLKKEISAPETLELSKAILARY